MTALQPDRTSVRTDQRDELLLITLDGPKTKNSIGPSIYEDVQTHVVNAGLDRSVGAIVLTGANGFFSSGGNIQALRQSASGTLAQATANTDKLNAMIRAIVGCPKPVIAAVEGGAAGAGVSLVLACDLIVASDRSSLTAAYVRVGLSPDGGATHFLRSALPRQLVMEMCMLGQPISATRLAQHGVVNLLTQEGEALAAAIELAKRVASGPPEAIGRIKHLIGKAPENDLSTHLDLEARGINLARFSAEAAEGLSAFLEKRAPRFVR